MVLHIDVEVGKVLYLEIFKGLPSFTLWPLFLLAFLAFLARPHQSQNLIFKRTPHMRKLDTEMIN